MKRFTEKKNSRYDCFDHQILYCFPNKAKVNIDPFHIAPQCLQTPENLGKTSSLTRYQVMKKLPLTNNTKALEKAREG